jgi:TPR repeat protein
VEEADEGGTWSLAMPNYRDGGVDNDLELCAILEAQQHKLLADQNDPFGQFDYALCLENGRGVAVDLAGAAHYCQIRNYCPPYGGRRLA